MNRLLLGEDGDLAMDNGKLTTGDTTGQCQQLLLISNPGDFRENPSACVGAGRWLKDNDINGLAAAIKTEFEKDGMVVRSIGYDSQTENLTIDASYKTSSNLT